MSGEIVCVRRNPVLHMGGDDREPVETAAPSDRSRERLDARDLPPPQPLGRTLERLAELDGDVVLVQYNDRAPRHLFPKLDDRGYDYDTVETDGPVVTAIWRPE